ncbi:MAG: hypothetical protein WCI91_00220 [Candidatus Nomurabacteria bacterium]
MSKKTFYLIIVISFVVSLFFQWTRWKDLYFIDSHMWASQAQYVQTNDAREFDAKMAYGHPGGTVVEGAIIFHDIFKVPYEDSLIIFITIFNSLIISIICLLCFILYKNHLWWIITLSTLAMNSAYDNATPTSAIVSPLMVLLTLLTLYFYKNKEKINIPLVLFFSLVVGLASSTRLDIGVFCSVFFIGFLKYTNTIDWKKLFYIILGSFTTFCIFDPFMWFMPFQHIKDLIAKIIFHYSEFLPYHLTFMSVFILSMLTIISISLAISIVLLKNKIKLLVPENFIKTLIVMTIILYIIFLTSHYQAERYFQPIIFIWEVLLPLFIFNLTTYISHSLSFKIDKYIKFIKVLNFSIFLLLVSYHSFLFYIWFIFDRIRLV